MATLKELQALSKETWTLATYNGDFLASPLPHRDFGHALMHVTKAAGKLAALVDQGEHDGGCAFSPEETDRFVADLVVCALRLANTCPGREIDLEAAVLARMGRRNTP
jgi:hypothetical protein